MSGGNPSQYGGPGMCQDTIEALLHAPDVIKALQGTLRRVKDVPRLLQRLQVPAACSACRLRLRVVTGMHTEHAYPVHALC